MFYELLVFGSMWFWIWSTVAILILLAWSNDNSPGWETLRAFIFLGLVTAFTKVNVWTYVTEYPVWSLGFAIGWLVVGFAWASWMLSDYSNQWSIEYEERKENFLRRNNADLTKNDSGKYIVPPELRAAWRDSVRYTRYEIPPKFSNTKAKIAYWWMWWPLSFLKFIFGDLLSRLIDHFKSFFQQLINKRIGNIDDDFANPV